MKKNKILKEAFVLLIAMTMVFSSTAAIANTEEDSTPTMSLECREENMGILAADGGLLWDNGMDEEVEGGWSMFDYTYAGDNRSILDDFVIPTGETWEIIKIHIIGVYFNNASTGSDMVVSFRNDNSGIPGGYITTAVGVNWSEEWTGNYIFGNRSEFLEKYIFDPVVLTAGTYWVEVRMVANDNFFAEVVNYTAVGHGSECWLNWPYDGYFGNGTDKIGYPADLKFALYEAVPTPVLSVNVTGGFGLTATVTNTGDTDATIVTADFTLTGGFFLLPPGGVKTGVTVGTGTVAKLGGTGAAKCFVFGIGKPTVTVNVTCAEGATASATYTPTFVILFFVL